MRRRALLAAALAALLAGCGDGRFEAELASALYAGPVRAPVAARVDAGELPPPESAADVGPERRLLALGAEDGDDRYLFGEVADVAVSRGGDTVYVLDRMDRAVRAFDARGEYLFRFGGTGDGPGEYRDPASLDVLPWSGNLAVWDREHQRLTLVTPAGALLRTERPVPGAREGIVRTGRKLRAWRGGFLLEVHSDPFAVRPERQRGWVVRLDTLARLRDTVLDFAVPPVVAEQRSYGPGTVSNHWTNAPHFTPSPVWDAYPDGGIALVPGGPYAVYRAAPGGEVRRITRRWTHRALTRRERVANLREAQERGMYGAGIPMLLLEAVNRKHFAAVRPALSGVLGLEGGGVAARRFDVGDEWEGRSRVWDEYGPDGAPRGSVRYPAGFEPLRVRGGRVYGVRRDSLGVEHLEVYRR